MGVPQTVDIVKVDVRTVAAGYRASKVIGSSVLNQANETIGMAHPKRLDVNWLGGDSLVRSCRSTVMERSGPDSRAVGFWGESGPLRQQLQFVSAPTSELAKIN